MSYATILVFIFVIFGLRASSGSKLRGNAGASVGVRW